MEWTIPLQKLEVSKVNVGAFLHGTKPLVPLAYIDGQIQFPSLNILLPPLTVKCYDPQTGKLDVSLKESPAALQKLLALQKTLFQLVVNQQNNWFGRQSKSQEDLSSLFQPMIENDILHLYCPVTIQEKRTGAECILVYTSKTHTKGVRPGHIQPGNTIRVAFRLQGISFHNNPLNGQWSGKFRFQHKILGIFISAED
jgi:hypothetical protein